MRLSISHLRVAVSEAVQLEKLSLLTGALSPSGLIVSHCRLPTCRIVDHLRRVLGHYDCRRARETLTAENVRTLGAPFFLCESP